jgi:hypothetical protein
LTNGNVRSDWFAILKRAYFNEVATPVDSRDPETVWKDTTTEELSDFTPPNDALAGETVYQKVRERCGKLVF